MTAISYVNLTFVKFFEIYFPYISLIFFRGSHFYEIFYLVYPTFCSSNFWGPSPKNLITLFGHPLLKGAARVPRYDYFIILILSAVFSLGISYNYYYCCFQIVTSFPNFKLLYPNKLFAATFICQSLASTRKSRSSYMNFPTTTFSKDIIKEKSTSKSGIFLSLSMEKEFQGTATT